VPAPEEGGPLSHANRGRSTVHGCQGEAEASDRECGGAALQGCLGSGFLCVDHVAIAVRAGELESQVAAFKLLGFTEIHREDVLAGDRVREVLLRIGGGPNLIQLLEPLQADSPVQKFMDRNGGRGGLAHVAFRVGDVHRAFDDMKALGFNIIDPAPRKGSRGTTVFFVHPKSRDDAPFGFLIEVVQEE
jgi:methylmalonyl-CoA/ethylmalonyl-CoA epimerase